MTRYRPAIIEPGVSPPTGIASDETRRFTPTATAAPGAVNSCEAAASGCPHDGAEPAACQKLGRARRTSHRIDVEILCDGWRE
jgi:hypothetical protein